MAPTGAGTHVSVAAGDRPDPARPDLVAAGLVKERGGAAAPSPPPCALIPRPLPCPSPRLHLPRDHPTTCLSAPSEVWHQEVMNLNPKKVPKQWTHLQAPRQPNVTVSPAQLQWEVIPTHSTPQRGLSKPGFTCQAQALLEPRCS